VPAESGVKQIMSTTTSAPSAASRSERPGRILGRPVHLDPLDLRPRLVVDVGSVDAAGQVDHLVPGASQPRNQEAADMSAAADYHDAHDS